MIYLSSSPYYRIVSSTKNRKPNKHPTKMGSKVSRNEFTYSYSDEPHATRRKLILQKYPQIKKLMRIDNAFKWQVLGLVLAQISSFYLLRNTTNFWILLLFAYCIGGVANHAIMLGIHEISHGMGFGTSKPLLNKILSIIANLPIGIPMSISFKKYHLEHHRYQGDELLDTDIPTFMEAALFTSSFKKLIWCLLQPFFYTLRPLFIHPKPLESFELINIITQLVFDLIIIKLLGWHILAYMIGGSVLAMGLHPVAGHFISEHTLMFHDTSNEKRNEKLITKLENSPSDCDSSSNQQIVKTITNSDALEDNTATKGDNNNNNNNETITTQQNNCLGKTVDEDGQFLIPETCSYYGPLNWLTFNVGYHVEHHDFPSIPGSRLHLLSKIAPEFYLNLNYHTSWTYVLWQYITDPKVGPSARVRRRIQSLKGE